MDTESSSAGGIDGEAVFIRARVDRRALHELHPPDGTRRCTPLNRRRMKLRCRAGVLRLVCEFTAKDNVLANPGCCSAFLIYLLAHQVLAAGLFHPGQRFSRDVRAE